MTPNVDEAEVAKFDAIASEWWNVNGPMKPLHDLNPLRLAYIQEHIVLENQDVIDIGCGAGILTESLATAGAHATGIDLSEAVIQAAKHHAQTNHLLIDYYCISTEAFAQSHPAQFDVVTCMEMLEHVPDPVAIMQSAFDVLKPGGKAFFSTLNRNVKSFFSAIIGAEYILNLLPRGTHHYKKFIRPSELNAWASQIGFDLKDIRGITYNPLTQQFKLSQNVDVNYLVCFKK